MGNPYYDAPEQALKPQEADVRADIYGLGCTLYHLIAGQPPFPGGSLARKLLHHQTTPPPSVRDLKPEVPQELAASIQKMMAKNPDDRPKTPAAVAVALSPFIQGPWPRVKVGQFRPPEPPLPEPPARSQVKPTNYGQPGGPPDRRVHTRFATYPTSVQVFSDPNTADEPLRAWLLNRSLGGLALLVEEAIEIETDVWVRPTAELYSQCWFSVRIIYCVPERIRWRVGCQFLEPVSWDSLRVFG
jgi:serine/threonine protein kinase